MNCRNLIFTIICVLLAGNCLSAQQVFSSDDLFKMARTAAFVQKDYSTAIDLASQALNQSPGYNDIRVFLGRLYTWTDKYELAKAEFRCVLEQKPDFEDASVAITDLEYWKDNYDSALNFCNDGLKHYPESEELLLRKAKILNAQGKRNESFNVATCLIDKYPQNESARSLLQNIHYDSALNKVSISHDFIWFNGNYANHLHHYPWHIVGLDYSRYTSIGSVIARINYGNRFGDKAFQFEMDSYPHLMKNITAYINLGMSDKSAVFPRYRIGMSLYASLPRSFEAEAGFRLLHFSDNAWIYVGSVSKYYKNFWFNGRAYFVPGNQNISHSYTLITRYYFGGVDDYLKFSAGYGLSPDEANSVQGFASNYRLRSWQFSSGVRKNIRKFNVIGFSASVINQEFDKAKYGVQVNTSVTYIRRF